MGTNYYVEINKCHCCGRSDVLHVGKSSAGWTFSFRGYLDRKEPIQSWNDWVPVLTSGRIYNEYNNTLTFSEFEQLVDGKRSAAQNHAQSFPNDEYYRLWIDDDGNSFSGYEFS